MLSTISSRHELVDSTAELLKSNDICIDSTLCFPTIRHVDTIDNPLSSSEVSETEKNIFKQMKYERNRLYSFQNKWPLQDITPESLAGAGLFYLQLEDKVQCPFCYIVISNWTNGDNPLREHMRRRPKCPFLIGSDVGNVPLAREKHQIQPKPNTSVSLERNCLSHSVNLPYKPKDPRMADVRRRILTYSGWPVSWLSPQQLAECGLYYTGVSDVVTCFFCGGSLGNWEHNDDPWGEHTKFFPYCAYLELAKDKSSHHSNHLASCTKGAAEPFKLQDSCNGMPSDDVTSDITSDIIREARDIFPEDLVLESVKRSGGNVLSLQELCDDILELNQEQVEKTSPLIPDDTKPKDNDSPPNSQALLCVICMDRERGIAYQPCGHFVSCPSCASKLADCPVCRKPITHKIRIYHT